MQAKPEFAFLRPVTVAVRPLYPPLQNRLQDLSSYSQGTLRAPPRGGTGTSLERVVSALEKVNSRHGVNVRLMNFENRSPLSHLSLNDHQTDLLQPITLHALICQK